MERMVNLPHGERSKRGKGLNNLKKGKALGEAEKNRLILLGKTDPKGGGRVKGSQ